ncbi:unnamed protein product, partial [Allacma fusca]
KFEHPTKIRLLSLSICELTNGI